MHVFHFERRVNLGTHEMSFLPKDVQHALREAQTRKTRRANRLSVHVGDAAYPVERLWDGGFAISVEDAPKLRGHVDLYNGPRHVYQCLIVTSREEGAERVYDFKWNTEVADRPAVDYVRAENAPVALLTDY